MKKKVYMIFIMLALLFYIPQVFALENVNEINGSISGKYIYENKIFKDKNVYMYSIAELNEDGYIYLEKYNDFNIDINSLKKDEWLDYSNKLSEYIFNNKISYDLVCKTDESGAFKFEDLKAGLYIVMAEEVKDSLYRYSASVSLVSIPNLDEISNEYVKDLTIEMKIEEERMEPTTEKSTSKTSSSEIYIPQTLDNIEFYVVIFIISLLLLIGLLLYYIFILRKEDKNEEEQNK